ncbi:MAG: hypothetical protein IT334_00270 [Thermomicrobiales bacterium]|nr:hypothetical protein [Thermomicrobiales bacterium]
MKRLRSVRARSFFVFGLLTGLLIASTVTIVSARRHAEPSIHLLASGNGLSALITGATGRVLMVNGDDPAAFSNAFGDATADPLRRIDLVILMPDATEQMAERAVNLAAPERVFALPHHRMHPGNRINDLRIRAIDGTSEFRLDERLTLTIDPGADRGWTIEISFDEARIVLARSVPIRTPTDVDLLIIGGPDNGKALGAVSIPTIAPESDMPGEQFAGHAHVIRMVGSEEVVTVRLRDDSLRIDG